MTSPLPDATEVYALLFSKISIIFRQHFALSSSGFTGLFLICKGIIALYITGRKI